MPRSDYYSQLREKIGHDLLLIPAAAAVIFDEHGRVLLAHHSETDRWRLPGGAIEPDESPAAAMVREIFEETGLIVEPTRLMGLYGGPEFRVTYRNGDQIAFISSVFQCRVLGGSMPPDHAEILGLRYFSQAELAAFPPSDWMKVVLPDIFRDDAEARFRPPTGEPSPESEIHSGMPAHIARLRASIGHDLVIIPAAGAIIFDEQGRLLLQQRADNGDWHPPAGCIEPDESPTDAVMREVWEETGLLVEPIYLTGIYNGPEFHFTYPHGDQVAIFSVMFACRVMGGNVRPDGGEVLQVRYYAPHELTDELLPTRWRRRVRDGLRQNGMTYFEPARSSMPML